MKKNALLLLVVFVTSLSFRANSFAAFYGSYIQGGEGIKAATLPPPGFYIKQYDTFYDANTVTNKKGDKLDLQYGLTAYATVNRFVWITDKKLFGADYGLDVIIPLAYQRVTHSALNIRDSMFAFGDPCIEPFVLAWHKDQYDAAVGVAEFFPLGRYDVDRAASIGKDVFTTMFTLGGTYYFDSKKTYSASILNRYEIHSAKTRTHGERPGNDFSFEWGIAKSIGKNFIWDVGVSGYDHWQVTNDKGSAVTWDKSMHDQVHAVGPEIDLFIPKHKIMFSLRTQWEYSAKDHPKGQSACLSITKIF